MKALVIALLAAAIGMPAFAQHAGHEAPMPAPAGDSHAGHQGGTTPTPAMQPGAHADHEAGTATPDSPPAAADPHAGHSMEREDGAASIPPEAPPPPAAFSGPGHAADTVFDPSEMGGAREELRAEQGALTAYSVQIDQLEVRIGNGEDGYRWDAQGWYGGDINKLWITTEGEGGFGEETEDAEVQALWSRAITPWFDVQSGLRYDFRPEPTRGHLVAGVQGLMPYLFEVDAAAFVSDDGDVSARIEAEYELLMTQRLILQPRAEVNVAAQEVAELGIGSGVNDVELGVRLRYEFAREFAPYVGVHWERKLGETADFARDEGESVDNLFFVTGLRIFF